MLVILALVGYTSLIKKSFFLSLTAVTSTSFAIQSSTFGSDAIKEGFDNRIEGEGKGSDWCG